jgi:hypothetical protein
LKAILIFQAGEQPWSMAPSRPGCFVLMRDGFRALEVVDRIRPEAKAAARVEVSSVCRLQSGKVGTVVQLDSATGMFI